MPPERRPDTIVLPAAEAQGSAVQLAVVQGPVESAVPDNIRGPDTARVRFGQAILEGIQIQAVP